MPSSNLRGETPFHCDYQGRRRGFRTTSHLKQHKLSHTDGKAFQCDYQGCKKGFNTKSYFNQHKTIHTGTKPLQCTYEGCRKTFMYWSSVYVHKRLHITAKPFDCKGGSVWKHNLTLISAQSINLRRHIFKSSIHLKKVRGSCMQLKTANKFIGMYSRFAGSLLFLN